MDRLLLLLLYMDGLRVVPFAPFLGVVVERDVWVAPLLLRCPRQDGLLLQSFQRLQVREKGEEGEGFNVGERK